MVDYEDILEEVEREEKVDSATTFLEKKKEIEKEVRRLNRLFREIDENKKKLVQATVRDIAFMTVTMRDLRENIIRRGTTCSYKNGENQYGTKQSPEAQMYLQMSQKQTQAMKILVDCLPKKEKKQKEDGDGFEDFINSRQDT